jgi:hypothetical protein
MDEIKGIARVKFHPGKVEEWKRERYRDADAAIEHFSHISHLMDRSWPPLSALECRLPDLYFATQRTWHSTERRSR